MPTLTQRKLFISHSWRYSDPYNRLINFLNAEPNFLYSNYSIPSDKAFDSMSKAALQEELKGQIRPAQIVIILAGMWTNHSEWIEFEMNFAQSLGKPILGIKPWDSERVPLAITNASNEIVGWNTSSIVSAIRRLT